MRLSAASFSLAGRHAEVHPQGSSMHRPTLRPQIHTPTHATSVLPLVARVKGLLVLLGCRVFVAKLLPANPDLRVAGGGMRCLSALPSVLLFVLVWVRGSKTKQRSCLLPEVDFSRTMPHGLPTRTRVCSTDEAGEYIRPISCAFFSRRPDRCACCRCRGLQSDTSGPCSLSF